MFAKAFELTNAQAHNAYIQANKEKTMKHVLIALAIAFSGSVAATDYNELAKQDIKMLEKSIIPADQAFLNTVMSKDAMQVCDDVHAALNKKKTYITESYKPWVIKYLQAVGAINWNNQANVEALTTRTVSYGINACVVRAIKGRPSKVSIVKADSGGKVIQYVYGNTSVFMLTPADEIDAVVSVK